MNDIMKTFLLTGDKFMPPMHSRKSRFTYSACGRYSNNKERIKKLKETGYSRYIYQKEFHKTYFQHDIA